MMKAHSGTIVVISTTKYKRLHNFFDSKGGRYVVLHYSRICSGMHTALVVDLFFFSREEDSTNLDPYHVSSKRDLP